MQTIWHQDGPSILEAPMSLPFSLTDRVTFSAGTDGLDRASHLRAEAARLLTEGGRVLPLVAGRALIDLSRHRPRLHWIDPTDQRLHSSPEMPVFLGLAEDRARFAADLSSVGEQDTKALFPEGKFIDLRSIAGELSPTDATIAAAAKGVLSWHESHPRCSRCGAPSAIEDGGWRRRCTACRSLHFPRTDPVVIMLVVDGEETLIGRQAGWPDGLYSLLAGFMEPGETIEEAVRREVREEAAVRIGPVRYLGCQPWPFPTTLMIGCVATALSRKIVRDPAELEDARWISRREMASVLAGEHAEIRPARVDAIARSILEAWVAGEIGAL